MVLRIVPAFVVPAINHETAPNQVLSNKSIGKIYLSNDSKLANPLKTYSSPANPSIQFVQPNGDGLIRSFAVDVPLSENGILWASSTNRLFQPFVDAFSPKNWNSPVDFSDDQLYKRPLSVYGTTIDAGMTDRLKRQGLLFDIEDFGARADGSNATPAIQAAANAIRKSGGGWLFVPPKDYYVSGVVEIFSDTHVFGPGSTLYKRSYEGESSYAFFCTRSHGERGYGSGGSRLRFSELRFKGNFKNGRTAGAFAFHHTEDAFIKRCLFEEMQGIGHIADLAGCQNITFSDSSFVGSLNNGSRAEAIQIDLSAVGAVSVRDDPGSYDSLPTRNVRVQRCQFLPLKIGHEFFPAPPPIGSHSSWEGRIFQNILFIGNHVLYPRESSGYQNSGIIHFSMCNNILIDNNVFVGLPTGVPTRVVALYSENSGRAASDDPNIAGSPTSFNAPVPPTNITISNNTFLNWGDSSSATHLIYSDVREGMIIHNNAYKALR